MYKLKPILLEFKVEYLCEEHLYYILQNYFIDFLVDSELQRRSIYPL